MSTRFPPRVRRFASLSVSLFGALVLAAAAFAAPASTNPPPKSGKYLGKTSESSAAVSFVVSARGTKITGFTSTLGYNGKCGQGGGPNFSFTVPATTIVAGGHFSATAVGKDNATKGTIQITGSISKSSAHGTILEPKPFLTCRAPNQKVNPFSETFTASTH